MSFLKNIIGSSNTPTNDVKVVFPWSNLTDISQVEAIKEESATKKILIFKHSTRCGVSKSVIKQFEKLDFDTKNTYKLYYLDLLNHRDISNALASEFNVVHQSPQVIVIEKGAAVKHASHHDILGMGF